MISFDRINRRTHLYLGLFLMPWFLMYGVSSFLISHHAWFRSDQPPVWEALFERDYNRPVPEETDLREIAHEILEDSGMAGAFWAQRPRPDELRIDRFSFWRSTRLTYRIDEQRLRAERQRFRWDQVILRMHFRGGFNQPSVWNDLWAVLVDLTCLGILVWVISGLCMWWRVARLRLWGGVALAGGLVSFLLLLWRL